MAKGVENDRETQTRKHKKEIIFTKLQIDKEISGKK